MNESAQPIRFERRWPVALTIIAAVCLLAHLPGRVRLFPAWAPYVAGLLLLLAMAPVGLMGAKGRWPRVERATMLVFVMVTVVGTIATLVQVVRAMLFQSSEIGALQLLASSMAVWVNNIMAFALLYWQIDRGGPEARASDLGKQPDWYFPQAGASDHAPHGWRPTFVDYLFVSYSTATAFSATDSAPLTARAKLLIMLESTISLATVLVVAARAINILGG